MRSFLKIFDWSEHSPISSLFICILSLSLSLCNQPNSNVVKKKLVRFNEFDRNIWYVSS